MTERQPKSRAPEGSRKRRTSGPLAVGLLLWAGLTGGGVYALADSNVRAGEPPRSLSIEQAVAFALSHHPSLKARAAVESSRAAQTTQARMALLPRLDLGLQFTRATSNVVAGTVFPLPGMPSVTGPPMVTQLDRGEFGSAVSLAAAWDVAGLAQRMAQVDAALATEAQAQSATAMRKLEVAYSAADSYLQVWAASAVVQAMRAGVERAKTLATVAESYQRADLRPGADASRSRAELAMAQVQQARAEQTEAVARVQLAQALGAAGIAIEVLPMSATPLQVERSSAARDGLHPALRESQRAIEVAEAQLRATRMQYLPRVELLVALWSRGSGLSSTAIAGGLVPDAANWGAGLVVSWPALEAFSVRARVHAATAQRAFEIAQQEETTQAIKSQVDAAHATLDAALAVLQYTPMAQQAARATEQQALARYKAGLARVLDVADAQRLLAQAEAEDALARVGVLRARLLLSRALGDLSPFFGGLVDFTTPHSGRAVGEGSRGLTDGEGRAEPSLEGAMTSAKGGS